MTFKQKVETRELITHLGFQIRSERKRQKLTLKQFSKVIGITFVQLSNIENGKGTTSIVELSRIGEALGLKLKNVTFVKPKKQKP